MDSPKLKKYGHLTGFGLPKYVGLYLVEIDVPFLCGKECILEQHVSTGV